MSEGMMGTKIYITVSGGAETQIVHAAKLAYPDIEKILADNSAHDSQAGIEETVASGQRKWGDIPLLVNWDPEEASHAVLLTGVTSKPPALFKVESPTGADPLTFYAHIKKISRATEQEGNFQATITIKPTGAPQ